ncbi:MAG: RnfH family protein [Gammaproteobacteria bacterium]|nr:RnfH family protein [Gammaproteobacteria bacterium]
MENKTSRLAVEVVYALKDQAYVQAVLVEPGTTLEEAIKQSDVLQKYPEIDLSLNRIGIYAELRNLQDIVDDGDRIEIYRPLQADPKDARRLRADKAKKEKLAAGRK